MAANQLRRFRRPWRGMAFGCLGCGSFPPTPAPGTPFPAAPPPPPRPRLCLQPLLYACPESNTFITTAPETYIPVPRSPDSFSRNSLRRRQQNCLSEHFANFLASRNSSHINLSARGKPQHVCSGTSCTQDHVHSL